MATKSKAILRAIENLEESKRLLPEVVAYLENPSEREAAKALNLTRTKFNSQLCKLLALCFSCRKPIESKTRCEECLKKAGSKNPAQKAEYNAAYRMLNREKLRAYNKTYQQNNLERFRIARKKYDQTELGKVSAFKRRSTRLGYLDQRLPSLDYAALMAYARAACEACGSKEDLTLDHNTPLSQGGKTILENCNILCRSCNSSKGTKSPNEFFNAEVLARLNLKKAHFTAYKYSGFDSFEFRRITPESHKLYRDFVSANHYSQSCPGILQGYSLKHHGRVVAVAVFSKPSRQNITAKDFANHELLELSRFYSLDEVPKNLGSWFMAKCLKDLRSLKLCKAVVSYADTTEGHTGGLYKACNFELVGVSKENYHYEDSEGSRIHKRQVWYRAKKAGVSEEEQRKAEGLIRVKEEAKLKFLYSL